MIKKNHFIIMLGLSAILFCIGTIYAMASVEVTNKFETGIVDISLDEYQKNGDVEEKWEDKDNVLPNEEISKIPRIHNDGIDCYVRAKVTFRESDVIDESCLLGIDESWVKADDGYFYYTEILTHGSDVDLFQGVKIPSDLSEEIMGEIFHIDIDVDAIQSKNFTPQFEVASPWGSIEILKCKKEGQYDVNTFKQSDTASFAIRYEGDAGNLIKNKDDFFINFPYLLPGDVYSDTVSLVNDSDDDIKVYFRTGVEDESELLNKILLKITKNINGTQEIIYYGPIRAQELSENIILGTINKKSTGELLFQIEVPAEMNNEYTILDSRVTWVFSTEPIEEIDHIKHTGDSLPVGAILLASSGIILSIVAVVGLRRKDKGEVEDA